MPSKNIESVAKESRTINPKAAFRKKALVKSEEEYLKLYKQSVKNPEKFWSMASKQGPSLVQELADSLQMEEPVFRMVCRRETECFLQLRRPACKQPAAEQSRYYLGRRTRG